MDVAKRYTLFVEEYGDCKKCRLHKTRKHVVIGKGSVPADILLVGEAPGYSEDSQAIPFCGPAGHLLDQILAEAGATDIAKCFTNVVMCIPTDETGTKVDEPDDESVIACSQRLVEFADLVNPKLIVTVGKFATDWLDPTLKASVKLNKPVPQVDITHPAAILRGPTVAKSLSVRRCVVTIQDAIREYLK